MISAMQHYLQVIWLVLLFGIVHSIADNNVTSTEEESCSSSAALSDGGNEADFEIHVIQDDGGGTAGTTDGTVSFSSSSPLLDQQQNEEKMKKLDLHKLVYDIGQGPETTWVYKNMHQNTPEESTECQTLPRPLQSIEEEEASADADSATATQRSQSQSVMMAAVRLCKFYSLSNRTLHLILKHGDAQFELVKKYSPMMASAVACQMGQEFLFLDLTNPQEPVAEYKVVLLQDDDDLDPGAFLFVHDDHVRDPNGLAFVPVPLYEQYVLFQKTLAFDKIYRLATGRACLSNIGRARPVYPLWKADHVGQTHRVATIDAQEQETFLTLEAVSKSPRIFKIPNFLSLSEVQHILTMARIKGLKPSETSGQEQRRRAQSSSSSSSDAITRTSQTTWLSHGHSQVLKVIYQRAADILQIPHHIFRSVVTEDLQVVHYTENAEYKAHYDFGFPPITHPQQPTRFATLLIYLNDDMDGGETAFPRAVHHHQEQQSTRQNNKSIMTMTNSSTTANVAEGFKQKPETGTAILFYSMLPDGNMDERSLHAAMPVLRGEKYVCNLWVWDPVADLVGLN